MYFQENPKLIVARVTGFGQTGSGSKQAGHDINYVALSGVMPRISGPNQPYWPPANLLADFAGGGLSCAFAVCAALVQRQRTGRGAIIDVSMTESVGYLSRFLYEQRDTPILWDKEFGFLTGRLPWYRTYKTKDGKYMAAGGLEPKFHQEMFKGEFVFR